MRLPTAFLPDIPFAFPATTIHELASTSSLICAYDMRNVFGKIATVAVVLNVIGRIAFDCWREIPEHFCAC